MKPKRRLWSWFIKRGNDDPGEPPAQASTAVEDKRKRILRELSEFLIDGKSVSEIRDESELPYPKSLLLNAISVEIHHEDDDRRVEYLRNTAACLVEFQKGVGPEPVTLLGISDGELLVAAPETFANRQDPITRIRLNPKREKYIGLRHSADLELECTLSRLTAVADLRKKAAAAGVGG